MSLIRSRQRSSALVVGVLLLATPLAACGNYATEEIYTASAGVDYREGPLDVLSAAVVSAEGGSGTFIASLSNNSLKSSERILAVSAGPAERPVQVSGSAPISIEPGALVNLAQDPSITVSGDFIAGDYVSLLIDFENAEDVEMSVPVLAATDQYEGLDISTSATPTDEASTTE